MQTAPRDDEVLVAAMPRSIWNGTISFGLVNVPVQVVAAARDLDYHFHQLKDHARIEQRRVCAKENVDVAWKEIAHASTILTFWYLQVPAGGNRREEDALDRAVALIEALSTKWRPERYQDCYRKRLQRVIERKKAGERVTVPPPGKEPPQVPDLMEALTRSLHTARSESR